MAGLRVVTYDVEHGDCHVLHTPSDQVVMIDAGSKQDFSPAIHLNKVWGVQHLRWLTITHQDTDHLTDINNIDEYIAPHTLEKPGLSRQQLSDLKTEICDSLEVFLTFCERYVIPVPHMGDPSYNWGGVQFATFNNKIEDLETPNINDLGVVTFADYLGWTFIFPGDLERQGWLKLMEIPEFCDWLKRVDIFVAPHHGRESGLCEEVFEYCQPHLTIVSDKSEVETTVVDRYYAYSRGLDVKNAAGEVNRRYVLTTRSDGAINIVIDSEGRYLVTTSC